MFRHLFGPALMAMVCVSCSSVRDHAEGRGAAVERERVVLDGDFGEWEGIKAAVVDPEGDAKEGAALDIKSVTIRHDAERVYFLLDLGRVVNVQALKGRLDLVLDADGDASTGGERLGLKGADMTVEFTPPGRGRRGDMGVGLILGDGSRKNSYAAGLMFAPTYASDRIEVSLTRDAVLGDTGALFGVGEFKGKLVHVAAGEGSVLDETGSFQYSLTKGEKRRVVQGVDPLKRKAGDIRVISWNVEFGSIFKKPPVFARILNALKPDVILFQEMEGKNSGEQLAAFLNEQVREGSGEAWQVIFGEGGGNLRCAVASRLPMTGVESLKKIIYPDRPSRSLRIAAGRVETPSGAILVNSIHLKCCGSIGSSEDARRLEEVKILGGDIQQAMKEEGVSGVIITGDFNLVGSKEPLENLARAVTFEGEALEIANPMQLDGFSNTTWKDQGPFAPGRLDYALASGKSLQLRRGFVFESEDLTAKWLKEHGLENKDTVEASDHSPVVLDYHWGAGVTSP